MLTSPKNIYRTKLSYQGLLVYIDITYIMSIMYCRKKQLIWLVVLNLLYLILPNWDDVRRRSGPACPLGSCEAPQNWTFLEFFFLCKKIGIYQCSGFKSICFPHIFLLGFNLFVPASPGASILLLGRPCRQIPSIKMTPLVEGTTGPEFQRWKIKNRQLSCFLKETHSPNVLVEFHLIWEV